jgi:hypothetical protein
MSTDRTLNGTEPAADQTTSHRDDMPATGDSLSADRTERRRQRIATRQARIASEPPASRRRAATTESRSAPTPPKPLTLRDSVSVTSVAVLAAGGVLGAILGALGAAGWVIGLLAAALTVIVSAVLRRYSRSG